MIRSLNRAAWIQDLQDPGLRIAAQRNELHGVGLNCAVYHVQPNQLPGLDGIDPESGFRIPLCLRSVCT